MKKYFLMNVWIFPNSTLLNEHIAEIDKILQYTGGFCMKSSSVINKDLGFTHIISNYSDESLWSLCGSKDNTYPPYLVTLDWLWDCLI